MWRKSENSNDVKPLEIEKAGAKVYVRRNFALIPAVTTEHQERPEHWEYEENCMTCGEYDIYAEAQDQIESANANVAYVAMMADIDIPVAEEAE